MKWIKRIVYALLILIGGFELILYITGNTYVNKVLSMTVLVGKMAPDIDDSNLFPSHIVEKGIPQPWPESVQTGQLESNAIDAIQSYQTVAFLVIQNDSIIYERYDEGFGRTSLTNSFSMAKSVTGILIGCAISDGLIQSVNDPVYTYIPEFNVEGKKEITIRHLLTMSSGLNFKEHYVSPFAWPAEAYYGPDVNTLTLKADPVTEPGKYWLYKGGDTQLLGMILKKVTGKSVSEYAQERLWKPIGAEHDAIWSVDEQGMEKVSCCWYTNARDYARLAKLMMHDGKWNGVQVLDSAYVATSITAAQLEDEYGKPNTKYGYQWWLLTHKGHRVFYARGIKGQYVFAIPDLNMIVVRLGHKRAPKAGHQVPEDAYVYLDAALSLSR